MFVVYDISKVIILKSQRVFLVLRCIWLCYKGVYTFECIYTYIYIELFWLEKYKFYAEDCNDMLIMKTISHKLEFGSQCEKTCLPGFANNNGADQPARPRKLISTFVIHLLESHI